jgi:hypothetical protein
MESSPYSEPAHAHVTHADHCLNYLRQTILCAADMTLEPELVLGSGHVGQGVGVTHVCRDWTKAYDFVMENTREHDRYLANNGSHTG